MNQTFFYFCNQSKGLPPCPVYFFTHDKKLQMGDAATGIAGKLRQI